MNVLAMFSPKKAPLKLKGLKFKEFFKWIFDSAVMLSQSIPGETVKMDPETIKTWADLEN